MEARKQPNPSWCMLPKASSSYALTDEGDRIQEPSQQEQADEGPLLFLAYQMP